MRTVKEDRIKRLERRAARAGERAQARGEEPVGYESAMTYSNPRMMGGTYQRPIYSREQEILDMISSLIDDGDPLTPSMDPGMFEEEFSRSPKFRRGVLELLRDIMPDPRMRGAGKAQYGGGKSKGLNIGVFGRMDSRQKDYDCRVKGNC
tara:strand:- start:131 stop:580 length:450 start_codon:yes stop_codon:yes gene_type:complete